MTYFKYNFSLCIVPLYSFYYYVIVGVTIIHFYTKANNSYHSVNTAASSLNLGPEALFDFLRFPVQSSASCA